MTPTPIPPSTSRRTSMPTLTQTSALGAINAMMSEGDVAIGAAGSPARRYAADVASHRR